MKYSLTEGVRLVAQDEGGVLIREYPLRTMRCNRSLWKLLCALESDGHIVSCSPAMESLAEAGLVQRVWEKLPWPECPAISIIVPVKDRRVELKRCLESLQRLDYPSDRLQIIVVDDGSSDNSAEVARQAGAVCISSGGVGRGPAAARNKGADMACGDVLAFLDSDCTASPGWLRELASPFLEPETAAVGGLVRGYSTGTRLDRYEDAMSSLSLGKKEKWAGAGNDSFYLPSCNLLVRKEQFLALNGFDEKMRVGEDVDLCYRLRDSGFRIGYVPFGEIFHAHRNRIASFMSRRFAYGTSEALLLEKHDARYKKMQMSAFSFVLYLLLPTLFLAPMLAMPLIIGLFFMDVSHQLFCISRVNVNGRLSVAGIIFARFRNLFSLGYYVSYFAVRYYLPILIGFSVLDSKIAAFTTLTFFWPATIDYFVKKSNVDFASFSLIYFLEQIAYSCGVFWGCFKRTKFTSYRIKLQLTPVWKMER